jgi:hypothetical protein
LYEVAEKLYIFLLNPPRLFDAGQKIGYDSPKEKEDALCSCFVLFAENFW